MNAILYEVVFLVTCKRNLHQLVVRSCVVVSCKKCKILKNEADFCFQLKKAPAKESKYILQWGKIEVQG